jgi:uncharacterized protein DUF3301
MVDLLLIILILAGIWYWWDTQQCNETALFVCKKKCEAAALQLLDATVSRQRSWLRRGPNGAMQICRLYSFEYSGDQSFDYGQRQQGYIVLIGKQVVETNMPHKETGTEHLH